MMGTIIIFLSIGYMGFPGPAKISELYLHFLLSPGGRVHGRSSIYRPRVGVGGGTSERRKMLDKLWDDVVAGPQPEKGLKKLRQIVSSKPLSINGEVGESSGEGSKPWPTHVKPTSTPGTPATPGTPPGSTPRDNHNNVWRSVFNPGSNLATKGIGADIYDKPQPNSPTVYDWLYSETTRSSHR